MGQKKSKLRASSEEIPCHENLKPLIDEISKRDYPFENLVFEGGGARGTAYCGVVKALEEVGMLQKMHRFAGASAGAVVAACLSVDMTAVEVMETVWQFDADMLFDAPLGILSALPRILQDLGWLKADKIYQLFREIFERKTGNPDITFKEVYDRYGNELCIIVTNISTKTTEYLHPKTSPNISVALAIRTSMAIPLLIQPVKLKLFGSTGLYIDGGVMCNYPISCFDGWLLSMKPEHSFFNRFGDKHPLEGINPKTLGFLLFSGTDSEIMQFDFMHRLDNGKVNLPARPDTKLARDIGTLVDKYSAKKKLKQKKVEPVGRFLTYLKENRAEINGEVDIDAFKRAFSQDNENSAHDFDIMFDDRKIEEAFDALDKNGNGKFTYDEFLEYMNEKKMPLHQLSGAYKDKIKTVGDIGSALLDCLDITSKRLYVKRTDVERTVGIYTDYISTTDFNMENEDHVYLKKKKVPTATLR